MVAGPVIMNYSNLLAQATAKWPKLNVEVEVAVAAEVLLQLSTYECVCVAAT